MRKQMFIKYREKQIIISDESLEVAPVTGTH